MNIHEALLKEHSRPQTLRIVDHIEKNPSRFSELMDLFFNGGYRITQRASWVINFYAERKPEVIMPYLGQMLKKMKEDVHNAVKRNILRILQFIEIPEDLLGLATELSFHIMTSKKEPVANKVFAMTILFNISKKEPDLKRELKLLIEDQIPFESAAFSSRGKKILQKL